MAVKRPSPFSHLIGFDDGPFARAHRGDVRVVGAVFAKNRLDGVVSGRVRRDGRNSTRVIAELAGHGRFSAHLQLILLQGIALAGFNVIDIHGLAEAVGMPVLVAMRRRPDLAAIQRALLGRVPGGAHKWRLIEAAGAPERAAGIWVQRAGLGLGEAERVIAASTVVGKLPEPLRVAHLIAGGVSTGQSRGRA